MNVLVFRVGQLGDMLAALPAFRAVREHFKDGRLTLLSDIQHGKNFASPRELFEGAGIFNDYMHYVHHPSRLMRAFYRARLLLELRAKQFDTLVYLYHAERSVAQRRRDRVFFRLAGITRFIGMDGASSLPGKSPGKPLPAVMHEADFLLSRMALSGIPVSAPGQGRIELGLGDRDCAGVRAWLSGMSGDGGRPWIGIGPGSKMPSKIWPEERFRDAVSRLIGQYDFWPVVFGGPADAALAQRLVRAWNRGHVAAGALSLRESAEALKRCRIYLGNDTGTMHLAAAAQTPCVGIFSSIDYPGRWAPYGVPYRMLRKAIDCEGCLLIECIERRMECILSISVDEVVDACQDLIAATEKIEMPGAAAGVE